MKPPSFPLPFSLDFTKLRHLFSHCDSTSHPKNDSHPHKDDACDEEYDYTNPRNVPDGYYTNPSDPTEADIAFQYFRYGFYALWRHVSLRERGKGPETMEEWEEFGRFVGRWRFDR